jgi:hypothetical protein
MDLRWTISGRFGSATQDEALLLILYGPSLWNSKDVSMVPRIVSLDLTIGD